METIPLNKYTTDEIHDLLAEKGVRQGGAAAAAPLTAAAPAPPVVALAAPAAPPVAVPISAPAAPPPAAPEEHPPTASDVNSSFFRVLLFGGAVVGVAAYAFKSRSASDDEPLRFYRPETPESSEASAALRKRGVIEV